MKKTIKATAFIIVFVFAIEQCVLSAPDFCLRPAASAKEKIPVFQSAPVLNPAVLSIDEVKEIARIQRQLDELKGIKKKDIKRYRLEKQDLRSQIRLLEKIVVNKAITAAKVQIDNDAKTAWLHYDIVEGRQTEVVRTKDPHTSIGLLTPQLLKAIKKAAKEKGINLCVDVHLMVTKPGRKFIRRYIAAGANYITLHWEGFEDRRLLARRLSYIHHKNCKAGLACNPDANIDEIIAFIMQEGRRGKVALFQQMTTSAGRGGQKFMASSLQNIRKARDLLPVDILIQVDGGIDPLFSAQQAVKAGADLIISGGAFFTKGKQWYKPLKANYRKFMRAIEEGVKATRNKGWDILRDRETSKYYASEAVLKIIIEALEEREDKKTPFVIGLGSGTTVRDWFFPLIREAIIYGTIKEGDVRCISNSERTMQIVNMHAMAAKKTDCPDIMVIGVDAIDRNFYAMKGTSGIITDEKALMFESKKIVVIADESKLVPFLGSVPLTLEAEQVHALKIMKQLEELGAREVKVRMQGHEFFRPDNRESRVIIDADFKHIDSPAELARQLEEIKGVVTQGIFFVDFLPAYVIAGNENGAGSIESITPERTKLEPIESYLSWRTFDKGRIEVSQGEKFEQAAEIAISMDALAEKKPKGWKQRYASLEQEYRLLMDEAVCAYTRYCRQLNKRERDAMLENYFFNHIISFRADKSEVAWYRQRVCLEMTKKLLRDKWPHVYLPVLERLIVYIARFKKQHLDYFYERLLKPILDTEDAPGFIQTMFKVLSAVSEGEIFHDADDNITDLEIQETIVNIINTALTDNPSLQYIIRQAYNISLAKRELGKVDKLLMKRIRQMFTNGTVPVEMIRQQEVSAIAKAA